MADLTKEFVAFIVERERIRERKESGLPRAKWTKDSILATYRFCNIHREDDRVTRGLAALLRELWAADEHLWFAYAVARCAINKTDTMTALVGEGAFGKGVGNIRWDASRARAILKKRREQGKTIYGAAYMIGTQGNAGDKVDFIIDKLLSPMWKQRERLKPAKFESLETYHATLTQNYAVGSFTAAQVIADIKYVEPLKSAPDWHSFAASGPGSRRGLNRVMGLPHTDSWREPKWLEHLSLLAMQVQKPLAKHGIELHNQDLQNCLCEFDKYRRAVEGQGTPKQIYKPKENKQ